MNFVPGTKLLSIHTYIGWACIILLHSTTLPSLSCISGNLYCYHKLITIADYSKFILKSFYTENLKTFGFELTMYFYITANLL